MHSSVPALVWRQWRRLRWPMLLGFLLVVTVSVCTRILSEIYGYNPVPLSMLVLNLTTLSFIGIALVSWGDLNDLRLSFPSRLFTLPVRTGVLAACEFFSRLLAISVMIYAMTGVLYLLLAHDPIVADMKTLLFVDRPLIFISLTACIQAIVWCPGPLRFGVVGLVIAWLWRVIATNAISEIRPIALLPAIVVAFGLALVGVALDRREACAGFGKRLLARLWQRGGRRTPFASAAQAQLWFEWKSRGKYLPFLAAAFLVLFVAPYFVALALRGQLNEMNVRTGLAELVLFLAVIACPILAAVVLGMLLPTIDYRDRVSGIATFLMTRPVSTRTLASARLKMGALGIGATYALMFLIAFTIGGIPTHTQYEMFFGSTPDYLFGSLEIAWASHIIAYIAAIWTILWLGPVIFPSALALGCVGAIASGLIPAWRPFLGGRHVLWVCAVLVLAFVGWVFRAARRRRLLPTRTVWMPAAAWLVAGTALLAAGAPNGLPINPEGQWDVHGVAFVVAATLLAAVPFVSIPLTISWFRHR